MQKIKKFKINIVSVLIFMLLVITVLTYNWKHYTRVIAEKEQASKTQSEILQLEQDMKGVSDTLTYLARNYVLTNDISYFKEYWDIVLGEQGREQCLEQLEQYNLNEDGSVNIPEVLRPYMGGKDVIR